RREVGCHGVHRVGEVLPGAGDAFDIGLAAEFSFGADFASHAGDFIGEGGELVDHRADGVLQLEYFAFDVDRDLLRQVAVRDRRSHLDALPNLRREVGCHGVHRVGEVLPGAGDAFHVRLAAEFAFGADFAGDTSHFSGEGGEL